MSGLVVIAGVSIRQDAGGRYCLNDFHRAAGNEDRHAPALWERQAGDLIDELQKGTKSYVLEKTRGRSGGTFAAEELVYAYAMWISAAFHLKVIRAYKALMNGRVAHQVARIEGKQTRMELTDTIKDFVSYAKKQGSQSADRYYMSITKMEYAALGMLEAKERGFRDTLNIIQVHQLAVAEDIARQAILDGMHQEMPYKAIYQHAKGMVEQYAATLPQNRRIAA